MFKKKRLGRDSLYTKKRAKVFLTDQIKMLILDEADDMLEEETGWNGRAGGSKYDEVMAIYDKLLDGVQVVIVSATMNARVEGIAREFMVDPVRVVVNRDELALENLQQYYIKMDTEEEKVKALAELYDILVIVQAVVFVNSRDKVDRLAEKMTEMGYKVGKIHGYMPQKERDAIMKEFRDQRISVIISTNVFARGLDVKTLTLVIIYEFEKPRANYLHRIGRAGRYGRSGTAISFVMGTEEMRYLDHIKQYYALIVDELPLYYLMR